MSVVTEEEYSLLEEILMPGPREGSTPLRLTGTTFIDLYESISRRVRSHNRDKEEKVKEENKVDGIKFLSNFRNRKLSGGGRRCSDTGGRMDGLNFLWNFLSTNLPDQGGITHHSAADCYNNKLNKSPPSKGIIFINNLIKRSRRNDVTSQKKSVATNNLQMNSQEKNQYATGTTGISFLWSFFSKQLSESLEDNIQRRNEKFRNQTGHRPEVENNSDDTLQRVSDDDEDDSDTASTCSSISFVTASSTSSEEDRRAGTTIDPVTSTPVVRLLGNLDSQEESYYLETPTPSSDEETSFAEHPLLVEPDEVSWQRAHDYFESLQDYHLNRAQNSTLGDDSYANLLPENENIYSG